MGAVMGETNWLPRTVSRGTIYFDYHAHLPLRMDGWRGCAVSVSLWWWDLCCGGWEPVGSSDFHPLILHSWSLLLDSWVTVNLYRLKMEMIEKRCLYLLAGLSVFYSFIYFIYLSIFFSYIFYLLIFH